ncbi:serine O-acetyltransferase [Rheinheimera baltica]|uniref:Serine acetyltransferase n=1 Tax=Rheinheimera baltica TaxID=67576 RepID=A0ABT9HU81_9GAMM|nr:serine acetyltransferase [Rheinheimera baltica]MDP5134694.1 serine acetyltransferase [Rheinheimera baltica]MDP5141551.1 serine acetyltransferase [Rheinheimera baltica]MDP5148787.1 serine acetyltransferase [Rheinheimera baltica]MDP5191342.1 serine acetyltransferase [Rheinheimera baltica]
MKNLKADLIRKQQIFHNDGAPVSMLRVVMADGTLANVLYRLMRWCAVTRLSPLAYLCYQLNKFFNGCVIGVGADFGPGFVLMHPIGVVINSKVRGGANITIESGVVIGDEKGRSPVLENDIFIGAGAKVIGAVNIGEHVKIGANAVVTKSAPAAVTMLGIPAKPYVR